MAYNLEFLVRILGQILHPDQQRWNIAHDKRPQLESLLQKASSLKQILETCSPTNTQNLESEIRDAAYKAEDIIESHLVDKMLSEPEAKNFTISPPDLQQVIQEFDAAMERLMTWITHGVHGEMPRDTSLPASSGVSFITPEPDHPISSKDAVLGLEEDMLHLMDLLTGDRKKLEIIAITGMGGIGKTTLAQSLYSDPCIVSRFDARAWATISQEYNVQAILSNLLGCVIGKLPDELLDQENNELGVRLHKSLFGNRYLIILDDLWNSTAWDEIKMFFPNENNGSRIMVTTRELDVVKYVGPVECPWHHKMHLLNQSQSWNLLQQKVFGKDKCPTELEGIGKNIATNCRGLPLAIHVIGGLLSNAKRAIDFWKLVADDIRAALSEKDDHVFNVLSLSYNHLPHHLKACFLYMAAFPEDFEIRASKLIRLWVAEGFLKSNGYKNMEEEAEDCLKALADRNLAVVTKHKSNGKAKVYRIHDLLRDLCIRKADQEKFLYVSNRSRTMKKDLFYSLRRVSGRYFSIGSIHPLLKSMSRARSFLYAGRRIDSFFLPYKSVTLASMCYMSRLLRVLDVISLQFREFPLQVLQLVNLCYLAVHFRSVLPAAISRLCNLQTLILGREVRIESQIEISAMPELRHVKHMGPGFFFMEYKSGEKIFIHEKLQTLATIIFNPNFLVSIPNIKKLAVAMSDMGGEVNMNHLIKLETVRLTSSRMYSMLPPLRFPHSLGKLSLVECTIPRGFMTNVASNLPILEVLKIKNCVFHGEEEDEQQEWELFEDEFSSLRFLLLQFLSLVHWRATDANFPRLRHLVIRDCGYLEEIPDDIGDIPTLELIEVFDSSPGVVDSARNIKETQNELGNDDIEVRIAGTLWRSLSTC